MLPLPPPVRLGLKLASLFLVLLGLGLMIGGIVAFASPGKKEDIPEENKPRDWPVIFGLLIGGYVSFAIGRALFVL